MKHENRPPPLFSCSFSSSSFLSHTCTFSTFAPSLPLSADLDYKSELAWDSYAEEAYAEYDDYGNMAVDGISDACGGTFTYGLTCWKDFPDSYLPNDMQAYDEDGDANEASKAGTQNTVCLCK